MVRLCTLIDHFKKINSLYIKAWSGIYIIERIYMVMVAHYTDWVQFYILLAVEFSY